MPTAVEHGSVGREPGGNATLQGGSFSPMCIAAQTGEQQAGS